MVVASAIQREIDFAVSNRLSSDLSREGTLFKEQCFHSAWVLKAALISRGPCLQISGDISNGETTNGKKATVGGRGYDCRGEECFTGRVRERNKMIKHLLRAK